MGIEAELLNVTSHEDLRGVLQAALKFRELSGDWPDAMPIVIEHVEAFLGSMGCYGKAKKGEPVFTLLGRDLTAEITVDFWVMAQLWVRQKLKEGWTQENAVAALKARLGDVFPLTERLTLEPGTNLMQKIGGAARIAHQMEDWPDRKLAE